MTSNFDNDVLELDTTADEAAQVARLQAWIEHWRVERGIKPDGSGYEHEPERVTC